MDLHGESLSNELPLACSLSLPEFITRGEEIKTLFKDADQILELEDGYAFRFAGSEIWTNKLAQFITEERKCCPFFTFSLIFEPQEGPIWLHLCGPDGTKQIIQSMLDVQEEPKTETAS